MSMAADSTIEWTLSTAAGASTGRHRLALATVIATFVLILAGGNVTSQDAGLAVPDWPLSFGSVNPPGWITDMGGQYPGVRAEHGHRLIGAAVGLMVTALSVWTWMRDPRPAVRALLVAAWFAVVIQGIMGGLRVTEQSLFLAIVHGCFAHAFLCMLVAAAEVNSRQWYKPPEGPGIPLAAGLRLWMLLMVAVVFGQLILGALLRHTLRGAGYHIGGAVAVGLVLIALLTLTLSRPAPVLLQKRVLGLLGLYIVQMALGLVSLVVVDTSLGYSPPRWMQVYFPTAHVGVGALILAVAFSATLWTCRLSARQADPAVERETTPA